MSLLASSRCLRLSEFPEAFYGPAIASRKTLADTSRASNAIKLSKGRYSDEKQRSFTSVGVAIQRALNFTAATAAGCRLCLIACNSRHGDEVGGAE